MFILKKNAYKVTLLLRFLCLDSLWNFFIFMAIVSFRWMYRLSGMSAGLMRLITVCLILLLHIVWLGIVLYDRERWGAFLPKSLVAVMLFSNVYYLFLTQTFFFLDVEHMGRHGGLFTLDVTRFPKYSGLVLLLYGIVLLSLVLEFWVSLLLLSRTQKNSIATFFVPKSKDFVFAFFAAELKKVNYLMSMSVRVISVNVAIYSTIPEYNRTVDIAKDYLGIDNNCDLEIVECGKSEEDVITIPKEVVIDVTFNVLTGGEKKMCYGESGWYLLEECA